MNPSFLAALTESRQHVHYMCSSNLSVQDLVFNSSLYSCFKCTDSDIRVCLVCEYCSMGSVVAESTEH